MLTTRKKPTAKAAAPKKAPAKKPVKAAEPEANSGNKFDALQQVAAEYLGLVNITNPDNCRDMKERHDVLLERLKTTAKAGFSKN